MHVDFEVGPSTELWSFQETANKDGIISDFEFTVKYIFFEDNPLSLSHWQEGYYSPLPTTHPHFDVMYNSPPAVYEVPTNASELESEQAIASDEEPKLPETPATNDK